MGKLPFEMDRKIVVKCRASTNPEYGKMPEERGIREYINYGVINLDKPPGPTSHEVVSWVKKILEIKKAGHGGTLDPKVSGVLPIGLEESTKIIQTLLPAGKEYVCLMRLHSNIEENEVSRVFKEFEGEIYQRPPVKSAVKRKLRKRTIYYIEILEVDGRDILFKVGCEAGTYIRKLCHDIGEVIGVGAHMVELRRTKSGSFKDEDSVKLHDVMDAYSFWKEDENEKFLRKVIWPVEKAVEHLQKIIVRDGAVDAICHGANLAVPGICELDADIKPGDLVALFTLKNELIAIGQAKMETRDILLENSGIAVKTKRVVMKTGTYPRLWKSKQAGVAETGPRRRP